MDEKSLLVTVEKAKAKYNALCDKCGTAYIDELSLEHRQVKCFFEQDPLLQDEDDETIFIDQSENVIDLEEFLTQSLRLVENVVHVCANCQKLPDDENDEKLEVTNPIKWI